jgi:lipopolysaccharide export system permease protein
VALESKRLKAPKFGHLGLLEINLGHQAVGTAFRHRRRDRWWGAFGEQHKTVMTLFGRYVFRQVANAFLVILLTLTAIVWLATALRQLDLIISQGQGLVLFLKLTLLSLPSLMALIAPNAMLMAALYTLDRLNGDSELIVMTASGATIWRIGASLIALGSIVCIAILLANLFLTPASARLMRSFVAQVRTDLISQVLQPGRFSSPDNGLTFHIRDRSLNGDLLGLLVHDERDPKRVMSYLAERGRIITNEDGAYLVMFDGNVQSFSAEDADQGARIVGFDQYMLDLSEFDSADDSGKELRPRERSLSELIYPNPKDGVVKHNPGQLRQELHDRFATPLYPLLFAFLAVAVLGHARTTRESRWAQILLAFGIAVGLRIVGFTVSNLVTLNAWALIPLYGLPLGAILVAAWVAHVRMSPELRSKLNFELKFNPIKTKFWAGRGMQAK